MRVLFVSAPGFGHVQPMFPLATALQSAGHDVLWATGEDSCDRIEQVGIPTLAAGLRGPEGLPEYRRRYPEAAALSGEAIALHMFPRLFGEVFAPPMVNDLLEPARAWGPDLVVHEAAAFAGPLVAATLGIRHATHAFGDAVPAERLADAGARVAPLWEACGLVPPPFAGNGAHCYLDIYPSSLQPDLPVYATKVQPLRPVPFDAVPGDALPAGVPPPGDGPLVYLTLGTVFADSSVLRSAAGAVASLGVRLVVTVGPRGDPSAVDSARAGVAVERYIPQTLLFEHCDAVISHGGSGTFLSALSCGLPQVFLPQAADQFRNAARCAAAGAGIDMGPGPANDERLKTAVLQVLERGSFSDAASALGAEIAAMPAPEEVVTVLEGLA
ncbi:MAG: glycosyltransferase [Acidimicrobiales bacterium]